jgi:hypothetical protein
VTDADKGAEKAPESSTRSTRRAARTPAAPGKAKTALSAARSKLASLVWLVAVLCALLLAVGALLIALKANEENSIVEFVISGAEVLDGPFSLTDGIFTFPENAEGRVKSALVNWGIAAVVYLVIGKVLDRVIRP